MKNSAIDKSIGQKMRDRYNGPFVVISRNRGGAYILAELDGSVFDRPTAAFRIIPYFAREKIELPPLDDFLDVSTQRLRELELATTTDPDDDA
ncbi:Integrase catalytic domain-containing protein [Mycena indigotica]|uniref:Integrase catalytic domain-containing protein n=1 Tax=Mycena indigotica TaxID=2126181 RepID=A0A8H6SH81_9AGAR|nr:Integrase catalytic domain-containing protein [Mycena indigotica]KAF7299533.1 Integrase catalytic domain-containing protein [Mycena indigotica]